MTDTTEPFEYSFELRWADLDPNGHLRHTVYMDLGAQARIRALEQLDFGMAKMATALVGPILFTESAQYLREARVHDRLLVNVRLAGASENGKHFAMRHHVHRLSESAASGRELCCVIDCRGAWMDLRTRKVIPAPAALAEQVQQLPRTDDFAVIVGRNQAGS